MHQPAPPSGALPTSESPMTSDDQHDTIPPPDPRAAVLVPNLAAIQEPEEDAPARDWGKYAGKMARAAASQSAKLVLGRKLMVLLFVAILLFAVVAAVDVADHMVDIRFKLWRMSGHGP